MDLHDRIQKLPVRKKKILLWFILVIVGFALLVIFSRESKKAFQEFSQNNFLQELGSPRLDQGLEAMQDLEIGDKIREIQKKIEDASFTSSTEQQ